jgi:UDP-3-O-[3-hydroxymyristoyl] glucosamine N-acyltransferase
MSQTFTVTELAALTEAKSVVGERQDVLKSIAALSEAGPDDLSFLGNPRYVAEVATSKAGAILVPLDYTGQPSANQVYLRVEKPSYALALLCGVLESRLWPKPPAGIHPSAVIDASAQVDSSVSVGPHCVIGAGAVIASGVVLEAHCVVGVKAVIGQDTWLKPRVVIGDYCQVGARCRLQAGAVLGSDGFGYEPVGAEIRRIPQIGNVVLEDDVEVGANSTLDRARFSQTIIGRGSKIDNLVQIGHNVRIGRHCIIVAQVGIAGSVVLGDYCVVGGQAGIAGHLKLGNRVQVGGQAGVLEDIAEGQFVNGTPAIPFGLERRLVVLSRRLPDLFKKVDSLAASLDAVRKSNP